MTQIPEEYEVATQAIQIVPAASHTLMEVQQVYVDLWNAKYKNKTPMNMENVVLSEVGRNLATLIDKCNPEAITTTASTPISPPKDGRNDAKLVQFKDPLTRLAPTMTLQSAVCRNHSTINLTDPPPASTTPTEGTKTTNNTVGLHTATPILPTQDENEEAMLHLAFDQSPELLCFTTELNSDPGEPKSLREALEGPDADSWKAAISNEIMNFLRCDAWKKVPMSQVQSKGCKPVPTKTLFKIKHEQDGTCRYKAHIVTKGFMMIPGVDYT